MKLLQINMWHKYLTFKKSFEFDPEVQDKAMVSNYAYLGTIV